MNDTTARRRLALAATALAAVLVTAGCGPATGPEQSTSPTPSPTENACGDARPVEALQTAIDKAAAPEEGWSVESSDITEFNACSSLSWVVLKTESGSASAPEQVAFFHFGVYDSTAYDEYFAFPTSVERIDDATVTVTWTYPEAIDRNGEKRTESMSTYTWSDVTFSIDREGELPPYADGDEWNNNGPAPSN